MKHRGLKPITVILLMVVMGIVSFFGTRFYFNNQLKEIETIENTMQEKIALDTFERIKKKDFSGIYEETIKEYPGYYNEEVYLEKLTNIIEEASNNLSMKQLEDNEYGIYDGNELLLRYHLRKEGDTTFVSIPMRGQETITLEVPVGMNVMVNGKNLDSSSLVERNVEASNFLSTSLQEEIVMVDVYELDGCVGIPTLYDEKGNELAYVKDAITNHYLVGEKVEDNKIKERMIECGKQLALYPAQDTTLANVQEVSVVSSLWYQRYATLQNYWFTPHETYKFSNEEVLHMARQSEDTIVAEVIFDYYAENEEVSRTWYIGYQMTFLEVDGEWKVLDIEINNELNPRQIQPE